MMKVIDYSDVIKNKFREEIDDSLNALENEYDIRVMFSDKFIELFIEQFYELYMQKEIIYKYLDEMILAFHQACLVVIQEKDVLEEEYLLECIKYFMLMESPIEISPEDTNKTLKRLRERVEVNEQ